MAQERSKSVQALAKNGDHKVVTSWPGREYGVVLLLAALAGLAASVELILSEIRFYKEPGAHLICDINPLVGCSSSLTSSQAHLLFGIPNSVVGTAFFAGLLALALVLLSGGSLPRLLWRLLSLAGLACLGFVAFFAHATISVFHTLCPWCSLIWLASVPFAVHTWARAAQGGHLPLPAGLARFLLLNRWLLVVGFYALLAAAIGVGLADRIALVI
ncbi:MAG: vitamin K epoxide reductase family protein [Buchananella hordeovulneris]|nr:vitamin K epoxide reductase family protein [Buchananella hordeovulneris]